MLGALVCTAAPMNGGAPAALSAGQATTMHGLVLSETTLSEHDPRGKQQHDGNNKKIC